ncbi:MAG TPA: hypothetical protein VMS64_32945 [Candidatus Methylomirabilis sp.]|nr:hypothetical protein [Candidatus Methylomirabilis sp.]
MTKKVDLAMVLVVTWLLLHRFVLKVYSTTSSAWPEPHRVT